MPFDHISARCRERTLDDPADKICRIGVPERSFDIVDCLDKLLYLAAVAAIDCLEDGRCGGDTLTFKRAAVFMRNETTCLFKNRVDPRKECLIDIHGVKSTANTTYACNGVRS